MNTTNLAELKASPAWALLSPAAQATVREVKLTFPTVRVNSIPIPKGKINASNNTVVFEAPVKKEEILQIYNNTRKSWVYLAGTAYGNSDYGRIEVSSDGLVVTPAVSLAGCAETDVLSGALSQVFTVFDVINTRFSVEMPVEWTRPVIIIDPNQFNDTRTYDGAFPVTVCEARSLRSAPGSILWMFISDFNNPVTSGTVTVTQKVDTTELKSAYAELGKVIDKL